MRETEVLAMTYPDISTSYSMAMMCMNAHCLRACKGAADNVENAG